MTKFVTNVQKRPNIITNELCVHTAHTWQARRGPMSAKWYALQCSCMQGCILGWFCPLRVLGYLSCAGVVELPPEHVICYYWLSQTRLRRDHSSWCHSWPTTTRKVHQCRSLIFYLSPPKSPKICIPFSFPQGCTCMLEHVRYRKNRFLMVCSGIGMICSW